MKVFTAKQINIQVYCSNIHFNIQIAKILALQSHVWLTLFLIFSFVFDLEVKITRTDLFSLSYSQLNSSAKFLTAKKKKKLIHTLENIYDILIFFSENRISGCCLFPMLRLNVNHYLPFQLPS